MMEKRRHATADDGTAIATQPPPGSPRTVGEALPIFLRHGSPRIIIIAVVAAIAARLSLGDWSARDVLPVVGLALVWPLQEWLLHVYLLHLPPFSFRGRSVDLAVPRKHREHHRDPWNFEILFIPVHSWMYSFPVLVLIWWAVTPTAALMWTGIAAHLLLTLHYEWIHFMVHTRYTPETPYYRRIWKNHRLHHFKNENYWFGVTRLDADRLLQTAPDAHAVPLSPTVRTLIGGASQTA